MSNTLELLIDFHKKNLRQGPGSTEITQLALSFTKTHQDAPVNILDVGCGTGAQTLALAEKTKGQITAVDLFPDFLAALEIRAENAGMRQRITTVCASMDEMPLPTGSFDIVWSEGAIYNIGFEKGIRAFRQFIAPGGFLAITEITWLTEQRPQKITAYWKDNYPQIDTAANKIKQLEHHGFKPIAYFALPESCWQENYYIPLQARFAPFLQKYNNSKEAIELVEAEKQEIEMYEQYKAYYSYGFYIAQIC